MFKIVKGSTWTSLQAQLNDEKRRNELQLDEVKKRDAHIRQLETNLETCQERKVALKQELEKAHGMLSTASEQVAKLLEEGKRKDSMIQAHQNTRESLRIDIARQINKAILLEEGNNKLLRVISETNVHVNAAISALKKLSRGRQSVKTAHTIQLLEKAASIIDIGQEKQDEANPDELKD